MERNVKDVEYKKMNIELSKYRWNEKILIGITKVKTIFNLIFLMIYITKVKEVKRIRYPSNLNRKQW